MLSYLDYRCPVCGEHFTESDDIVVCPDCGAPHHRACWMQEEKCWYQSRHADGEIWKEELLIHRTKTQTSATEAFSSEEASDPTLQKCLRCGSENPSAAHFCQNCGFPLASNNGTNTQNGNPFFYGTAGNGTAGNAFYTNMISPDDKIEDIPVADVTAYVKTNPFYYIPVFRRIDTANKSRFHFCAFLFHGIWMLFRKQYKRGAIVLGIMFGLIVLSSVLQYTVALPIEQQLLTAAGIDISTLSGSLSGWSLEQQQALLSAWSSLSGGDIFKILLPSFIDVLRFAFCIYIGVNANRWYKAYCIQNIKKIREAALSEEDKKQTLTNRGGVNLPLMICAGFCAFLISEYINQIIYLLVH